MKPKLSAKRERFCQQYVIDSNGTQAAIRAGYSENGAGVTAFTLLKNTKIQERMAELQEEIARAAGLTAEYVVTGFMEVYERCMQKVPITNDIGAETQFTFNASGANKALEMLGKIKKLFEEKAKDELPKQTIEVVLSAGKGNSEISPLDRRMTGIQNGNN